MESDNRTLFCTIPVTCIRWIRYALWHLENPLSFRSASTFFIGPAVRKSPFCGMEQNVVALAFDVINLTDIQAHLSAFHFDRHIILFCCFLLHLFDSFSENLRKCKIGDRFYNISQGVYQISLNCELDRRGNKDKRYIFIQFPDFFQQSSCRPDVSSGYREE